MVVVRREGLWILRNLAFWIQKWCVRLLYCSYSQYAGSRLRHRALCEFMASGPTVPAGMRLASRNNLVFFARPAAQMFGGVRPVRLNIPLPAGFVSFNPSIHRHDGRLMVCIRSADFALDVYQTMHLAGSPRRICNRNFLAELDEDLRLKWVSEIPTPWVEAQDAVSLGFEDTRLFSLNGSLHFLANIRHGSKNCYMITAKLAGTDAAPVLEDVRAHPHSAPERDEKNWMPIAEHSEFQAVYFPCPTIVIDDEAEIARYQPALALDHLRGGSQLVAWQGGYLALVHEYSHVALRRHYLHRFVSFDAEFRLVGMTDAFVFFGHPIEFALGLTWHPDGVRLIAGFGLNEEEAWLMTFDAESVAARLHLVPNFPTFAAEGA